MKVAILYSGLSRGFKSNYENHKEYIWDRYNCDVFFNVYDMLGTPRESYREIITPEYEFITEEDKQFLVDNIKPTAYRFDSFMESNDMLNELAENVHGPVYKRNVVGMFYSLNRVKQLFEEYCIKTGTVYDVIFRSRTDMFYTKADFDLESIEENTFYNPTFKGLSPINDWAGYGSVKVMLEYHSVFETFVSGCQVHGEYSLWHHLKDPPNNFKIENTDGYEFYARKY